MARTHARTGRAPTKNSLPQLKPSRKANSLGHAKHQSRKAKSHGSIDDVYEYELGKSRRSNVRLELDRDEKREYGTGPDGEIGVDVDMEVLRARLIGETEDNEVIPSDDDEEIDSDAAFEESDEERFAGFFSTKKGKKREEVNKKKKQKVRFADVDLNERGEGGDQKDEEDEEEDEEIEGDEDEFYNLLDVLDGKVKLDRSDEENGAPKPSSAKAGEEEKSDFAPSDDEAAPEALDELENFISTLETSDKKRKDHPDAEGSSSQGPQRKKRQTIKERTEAGAENEFRAQSSGSKLQLEDLLAPLASQSSALQALKRSTKALSSSSSKYGKTLSAPLPQRSQERLDREAAYEKTKEEVDKWRDTMRRIREADHLSFPLQDDSSMGRTSTLELAAKFKPSNELESSVDALLRAANMRDEAELAQAEDQMLLANNVTLEEVAHRRAELRRMRELMFRSELKARRINKIKSKTYRRLKRVDKEKISKLSRQDEGDEEGEERMKRERERAMERATSRHKHTGKWSRQMKARGDHIGDDGRREMEEMLARGEKLRRRIQGVESDASEEEGDDDDDDDEGSFENIKQSAFDELRGVNERDEQLENSMNGVTKSVFNMKFMKQAMAREKAKADRMADDFLKELGENDGAEVDEDNEEDANGVQEDPSSGVISERVGGRVIFRPGGQAATLRPMNSLTSDTSSMTLKSMDLVGSPPTPINNKTVQIPLTTSAPVVSPPSQPKHPTEESNPWLTRPEAIEATSKTLRKNEVVISKDSKAAEKSKNKLHKLARKRGEEKEKAKDDATLEIVTEKMLALPSSSPVPRADTSSLASTPVDGKRIKIVEPNKTGNKAKPKVVTAEDDGTDSDNNSEIEAQERALEAKNRGTKAFQQRDLVALAFAGDNVVQQFEETKNRDIAADAPKEVDTTVPGWGTWGGLGLRKAPPKPSRIKKTPGIDPTTRADYGKKHVIISERRDKKAAKYMVKDLPFPYTSKAQFERSMENPLGTEWNTRVGFQRATLPRVVIKPGVVITPLKKFP
ncbi:hypothetical protein AX15_001343 [Amanita polypyramis BW_CC]|nr:hypothetical protein AX15_001343 [Amanita polypyramis BW_CC]